MPPRRRNIDTLAIEHLASGKTVRETAMLCGCDESTIKRRLRDSSFRQHVEAAKQAMIETIRGELRRSAIMAVQCLEALLACDSPVVRCRAATALLQATLQQHPAPEVPSDSSEGANIEYVQRIIVRTETPSKETELPDIPTQPQPLV